MSEPDDRTWWLGRRDALAEWEVSDNPSQALLDVLAEDGWELVEVAAI